MGKKIVSSFTLLTFVVFLISCSIPHVKKEKVTTAADWKGKDVTIVGVQKKSGEYIEFHEDRPGRIYGESIVATEETVRKEVKIDRSSIERIRKNKERKITEIITRDGKTYRVISVKEEESKLICDVYEEYEISIPLSEVELVWVKKVDVGVSYMVTILGVAAFLGLIVLASMEGKSCPFIYSFDGEKYIFDAEPYGGAICEGLKRTEWCDLEQLREINGQYKILVTNELDETQYTDELKLVVVDHPEGVEVIPDVSCRIHTVTRQIIPTHAYNRKGKDLSSYFSKNDRVYWLTHVEERNPKRPEDLRDELIIEFPKPNGAKSAKLIVNACNTFWGSHSIKKYLDLYGSKVSEWYEEVNDFGPAFFKMMNTHLREELYSLQIKVETEDGWRSKGIIIGGGPFVSKDKIYPFDISDVSGDVLKIKLTPPAAFWMINYLAVDYTEDFPVQVAEIEAVKAVDYLGGNVRETLAMEDNDYLIMPNTGDRVELIFEAPARLEGMDRSVFLKATGYYDIHLKEEGRPQHELLGKLHSEPGYVVQYAFKEFLEWKKKNMEKIKNR